MVAEISNSVGPSQHGRGILCMGAAQPKGSNTKGWQNPRQEIGMIGITMTDHHVGRTLAYSGSKIAFDVLCRHLGPTRTAAVNHQRIGLWAGAFDEMARAGADGK
jgi:hypothetical protein